MTAAPWFRSLRRTGLLALLAFAIPGGAFAQNLVANTGFAQVDQLTGWSSFGSAVVGDGSRTWTSPDVASSSDSGSATLSVTPAAPVGTIIGLVQCISVSAGATYRTSSRVQAPTGQTADGGGRLFIEVAAFTDGGCSTPLDRAFGEGGVVAGVGYPLNDASWPTDQLPDILMPLGTQSVALRLFVEKTLAGAGGYAARFDSVVFHDVNTVPVELMTFSAE